MTKLLSVILQEPDYAKSCGMSNLSTNNFSKKYIFICAGLDALNNAIIYWTNNNKKSTVKSLI